MNLQGILNPLNVIPYIVRIIAYFFNFVKCFFHFFNIYFQGSLEGSITVQSRSAISTADLDCLQFRLWLFFGSMIGVIFQWVRCYSLYRNSSHLGLTFQLFLYLLFLYLLFFVSRRVRHTSVLNNPSPVSTIKGAWLRRLWRCGRRCERLWWSPKAYNQQTVKP